MVYKNLNYCTRKDDYGNMTLPDGKRIVFISHRHRDNDGYLQNIVDEILNYSDCAVWYDLEGLTPGRNYDKEIYEAIVSADAMILLVSPTVFESDYVWNVEVPAAKDNGIPIIPIIIDNPDAVSKTEKYLDDAIQCIDYRSQGFHDNLIKSIEAFVINAEEENLIKQNFTKGKYDTDNAHNLSLEDKLLMAKGYRRGIGTAKNSSLAEKWLSLIASTDLQLYGESCKSIVVDALNELMSLYQPKIGAKCEYLINYENAAMRATELGFSEAAISVATVYRRGRKGVPRDAAKAIEWYERAAGAQNTNAMIALANFYKDNNDMSRAIEWYTKAAAANNTNAMMTLASIYKDGTPEIECNLSKAIECYDSAAKNGNVHAMIALAKYYKEDAKRDTESAQKSVFWYERASESGNTMAMSSLGKIYREGIPGIARSGQEAVKWYECAANANNTSAMIALATIYRRGEAGIECQEQIALKWYKRAADSGNINAMVQLGDIYRNGTNVISRDGEASVMWYERAAEKQNNNAIIALGEIYMNGIVEIVPSLDRAIEYFELAVSNGAANAESLLQQAKQIKAGRVAAAREMS